jgi:hypothetical protein
MSYEQNGPAVAAFGLVGPDDDDDGRRGDASGSRNLHLVILPREQAVKRPRTAARGGTSTL